MENEISKALDLIFKGIELLNTTYPNRKFTIDGRLVGDIGEIIASNNYDLVLDDVSQPIHDATISGGKRVQIKSTFRDQLTFKTVPEYYLGLKLYADGSFEEIYNGPAQKIVDEFKDRRAGFGKELLSFSNDELKKLSSQISSEDKIRRNS